MPVINVYENILIHGDGEIATANPLRRYVDWGRRIEGVVVDKPESKQYEIDPGATSTIFSGSRSLTVDGTTAFNLTLNSVIPGVYRLTWAAGTSPGFRTDRSLTLNTEVVTVTVNNNATADFALSSGSPNNFASVQVGDVVYVPHTTTGDSASPFSVLNVGYWLVLAKGAVSMVANKKLTMKRLPSQPFEAVAEAVTITANSQFQAFSASGVQIGDSMEISSGFSVVTQKTYVLSAVTPNFVEFTSAEPLPLESSILPTATGITIYYMAKRFLRVEVDQEAVIRLNGDTSSSMRLSPRTVSDLESMAHFEIWGSVWRLDIVNRSPGTMLVANVISCE